MTARGCVAGLKECLFLAGLFHIRLDSYAEMETLLRALREENIAIAELSLAETDLEQVFLRIMKNPESASLGVHP